MAGVLGSPKWKVRERRVDLCYSKLLKTPWAFAPVGVFIYFCSEGPDTINDTITGNMIMPRITGSFITKAGGSFIWADPKAEYHDCKDMVVQNFIVARK